MDDLEKSLFTVQNLTKDNLKEFSLARAKVWTKIMEKSLKRDKLDEEVPIQEIDKIFTADDEEQETDSEQCKDENIEECAEHNGDDSLLNISAIEQNVTISNAQNILAVIAQNPDTTGIINEDYEFLEKTLPIFEVLKREVREDGFEKLLDTFDERKINKNVGKMLRLRIHQDISPYKTGTRRYACADSDTDSDSIDEARYIRSTKKHCDLHQRYEITKIIKSYCLVDGRRQKLANDRRNKSMKDLSNRAGKQSCFARDCDCQPQSIEALQSCHQHSLHERHINHGKQNNSTRNHQQIFRDSSLSSSLDENEQERYSHANRIKNHTMPCPFRHNFSYNNSSTFGCRKHHYSFKNSTQISRCCNNEMLPVIRESDCYCRSFNKLCNHARHLANSSSDDWYVENDDDHDESLTPAENTQPKVAAKDKKQRTHSQQSQLTQAKLDDSTSEEKQTATSCDTDGGYKIDSKPKASRRNAKRKVQAEEAKKVADLPKKVAKTTKKAATKVAKNAKHMPAKSEPKVADCSSDNGNAEDDSFERELQLAIKASKNLYMEELKKRLIKKEVPDVNVNDATHNEKNKLRKTVKKNVSFQDEQETKQSKLKAKQQFVPKLADISSETEAKENTQANEHKEKSKRQRANNKTSCLTTKPSYSLDYEVHKCVKRNEVTAARKLKSKKTEQNKNKKNATKIKYQQSSNSADSEASVKPKQNKHSRLQAVHASNEVSVNDVTMKSATVNNSTCSSLKLHKLQIVEDTSSESTEANDITVKMRTTTTTTGNATLAENTTFFSNPGKICNSTALMSPTAKSRQLLTVLNETKQRTKNCNNTTLNHQDMPSTSKASAKCANNTSKLLKPDLLSPTDSSDCKQVSSTTETDKSSNQKALKPQKKPTPPRNCSRIVLYTPKDTTLVPESSFVNDKYRLTVEHLGSVIGRKYAEVFFRYYRGKREFKLSSTVNYIPPMRGYYSGDDTSEDDIDPLDVPDIGRIVEEKN